MNTTLIRQKIISGEIKTWQDVYGYTNPTEMSKAFGRTPKHWVTVRRDPFKITLEDMHKIIEALKISRERFYRLVGGED